MDTNIPFSFKQMTDAFVAHLRERSVSVYTERAYVVGLRLFVQWFEGTHGTFPDMRALTPTDMADYCQHLHAHATATTGQPLKPATIDQRMTALRAYYAYLCKKDETVKSPMTHIKTVASGARARPESLSDRELADFVVAVHERIVNADSKRRSADKTKTACEARRDLAIVATLAYAGLRASELCELSLEDITLGPYGGELVIRRGEGDKFHKVVLCSEARKALSEWLQWRQHYGVDEACRAVFVGRRATALSVRAVQKVVKRIVQRAKASGFDADASPRTLRQTFARRLADGNSCERQNLMGHQSIATAPRYTPPSRQQRDHGQSAETTLGNSHLLPPKPPMDAKTSQFKPLLAVVRPMR